MKQYLILIPVLLGAIIVFLLNKRINSLKNNDLIRFSMLERSILDLAERIETESIRNLGASEQQINDLQYIYNSLKYIANLSIDQRLSSLEKTQKDIVKMLNNMPNVEENLIMFFSEIETMINSRNKEIDNRLKILFNDSDGRFTNVEKMTKKLEERLNEREQRENDELSFQLSEFKRQYDPIKNQDIPVIKEQLKYLENDRQELKNLYEPLKNVDIPFINKQLKLLENAHKDLYRQISLIGDNENNIKPEMFTSKVNLPETFSNEMEQLTTSDDIITLINSLPTAKNIPSDVQDKITYIITAKLPDELRSHLHSIVKNSSRIQQNVANSACPISSSSYQTTAMMHDSGSDKILVNPESNVVSKTSTLRFSPTLSSITIDD